MFVSQNNQLFVYKFIDLFIYEQIRSLTNIYNFVSIKYNSTLDFRHETLEFVRNKLENSNLYNHFHKAQ